ncbi:MAG TPA: hypothetical protein VD840_12065 [Sinorhizobium sp.]|nr:hypothetical protein [Sinorhizobium sp.]
MPKKRIFRDIKDLRKDLLIEMLNDKVNLPEAYADRIAREFGNGWYDAYEIYRENPEFWDDAYQGDPNHSPVGPKIISVPRTSRLPAAASDEPEGKSPWERLFPGRTSLKRAIDNWRE